MRADFFTFLGILILLFVLWVSTGGPSRPISFSGPYLNPIQTTGTTAQPYGDPTKFSSLNQTITVGPRGVAVQDGASPLREVVSFSSDLTGTSQNDPEREYVVIRLSTQAKTGVSTTGWKLVSTSQRAGVVLPYGTETPRAGRVNPLTPIILRPGEEMIVSSGRSPVGVSFRENKCTGYFEEHQDFYPPLGQNCPTASQEFSRFYNGDDAEGTCLAYIRSIPYCATETRLSTNVSSSCDDFVETYLNYNGCVNVHSADSDFSRPSWRVYLGADEELWRGNRETITLLDADNKVIDSITY